MDFDDLLALWLKLLLEHPAIREEQQRRFQFILVDEYQDTNKLQGALIDLLAATHHNVMAVGDDCQSIYSWRGAHFLNILKFPDRHPGATIYRIETNYRSTPEILRVANAAIAANVRQFPKELAAARPGGVKPVLVACGDGNEQAAFIAHRVLQLREEGIELNKMAVLYRAHFHALELQFELTRRNIPFTITSGLRFVRAWPTSRTSPPGSSSSPIRATSRPSSGSSACCPASAPKARTKYGTPSAPRRAPATRPWPPPCKKSPPPFPKNPPCPGRNSPPPSPSWKSRKPAGAPPA